jgi:hypothetical protein
LTAETTMRGKHYRRRNHEVQVQQHRLHDNSAHSFGCITHKHTASLGNNDYVTHASHRICRGRVSEQTDESVDVDFRQPSSHQTIDLVQQAIDRPELSPHISFAVIRK